jgi:hypothetical protein
MKQLIEVWLLKPFDNKIFSVTRCKESAWSSLSVVTVKKADFDLCVLPVCFMWAILIKIHEEQEFLSLPTYRHHKSRLETNIFLY